MTLGATGAGPRDRCAHRRLRPKLTCAAVAAFAMYMAVPALGASVAVDLSQFATGSRTESNGIIVSPLSSDANWDGDGDNGFRIAWQITPKPDNSGFTYQYWFSGSALDTSTSDPDDYLPLSRGLSHWNMQISDNIDTQEEFESVFSGFSLAPAADTDGNVVLDHSPGAGNPGMPGELHGLKFETPVGVDGVLLHIEFMSTRFPMWGDGFFKDGRSGDSTIIGYNAGFGQMPSATDIANQDFTNWIPVPDTMSIVPLPAAAWAGLAGFSMLGGPQLFRRRRRTATAKTA